MIRSSLVYGGLRLDAGKGSSPSNSSFRDFLLITDYSFYIFRSRGAKKRFHDVDETLDNLLWCIQLSICFITWGITNILPYVYLETHESNLGLPVYVKCDYV